MTYTFDVKVCDNEINNRYARFPISALKQIEKLARGKSVTLNGERVAEILDTSVVRDGSKTTKAGDLYCWVKARVNIKLNDETSSIVYEIENGGKNYVSVGCSVENMVCSICGAESCGHIPGDLYSGQLCYKELYGVNEIYRLIICEAEKIVKDPKWTAQEIEDAKAIQRMFGKDNFTHVQKDEEGWPSLMDGEGRDTNVGWCSIGMEKDMFPSLEPGQTVTLDEIIGGAE